MAKQPSAIAISVEATQRELPSRRGNPPIDISDRTVAALPFGSGVYRDVTMRGFYVICNAASKSFVLQRDVTGRAVRYNLGRFGDLSAKSARDLAEDVYVNKFKQGIDPNREKRVARARGMTLDEAFNLYKATGEDWSPKTLEEYERIFRLYLRPWEKRTMEEIGNDRDGCFRLHRGIRERVVRDDRAMYARIKQEGRERRRDVNNPDSRPGTYPANRALELLRYIYKRALRQEPSLPPNPTDNVDFFKRRQRNASLKTEELKPWFNNVNTKCSPVKRDFYLACILTGGRRNQMAEARWEDIDFKKATWFFPRPKGGKERAYTVPISKYLIDVLKARRENNETIAPRSPWVFPSDRKKDAHLAKPRDDKRGLPACHALRHTYKTYSVIAGVREIESHLLMNHALGGSNAGYISREVTLEDHLRPAQERITEYFLRKFDIKTDCTRVVDISTAAVKTGTK